MHYPAARRGEVHVHRMGVGRRDGRMAWTALRRPSLIPLAVTLAIYGHHFRTVSERHLR